MDILIKGKDWSEVNADKEQVTIVSPFSYEEADDDKEIEKCRYNTTEYFERYRTLASFEPSPFNMGIYQTVGKREEEILKTTKYIGVLPMLKISDKWQKREVFKNDTPWIKISSRFDISPTEMLNEVLSGDDYYENPDMLKTHSYSGKEWRNLAGKRAEKSVLFGIVNGVGQAELSGSAEGTGDATEADLNIVEAYGVFEIIDFVNKAKEICKKNLKKQSQRVEENLNCKVKGRILVQKQIKHNVSKGQVQKTYCAYNTMSVDIKENQIIKYALHLCQKNHGIGDSLAEDIRFCMNTLSGVPLKKCSASDFVGLKNNGAYRQYKEAINAAKKVISRYSISYTQDGAEEGTSSTKKSGVRLSSHKVLPYFIDMNLLFEYYCRAIFRKAINEYNSNSENTLELALESTKEARRLLFECDSDYLSKLGMTPDFDYEEENTVDSVGLRHFFMASYIPDIVIRYKVKGEDSVKVAAVIDAKYSNIEKMEKRARTHQVLFYMKALKCDFGGLISPSWARDEIVNEPIYIDGIWQKVMRSDVRQNMKSEEAFLCYIPLNATRNDKTDKTLTEKYVEMVKCYLFELAEKLEKREKAIKLEAEKQLVIESLQELRTQGGEFFIKNTDLNRYQKVEHHLPRFYKVLENIGGQNNE